MDLGINGWFRIRLTSARTAAALSFIVSQSMNSPSVDPGPFPTSRKPLGVSSAVSRLLARRFRINLVREEQHAAVGVVNDEELIRAKQLVGDDQGAERVVARAPSGIANDVSISLRESGVLGRIQTGVHARENRKVPRRWYRQLALRAKRRSVARIRLQNFW